MDVAAWLRGLGLEQYAQLFRENDIDGEILCGMSAEDLKELGITAVELMPVWQFPGRWSWGYDGVCPFAPRQLSSRPEDSCAYRRRYDPAMWWWMPISPRRRRLKYSSAQFVHAPSSE